MPKLPKTIPPVGPPGMAVDAATQIVDACREWMRVHETEKTKRTGIVAQRDVYIAEINKQRDVLIGHLRAAFAQQGKALDELFKRLDTALETGDPDLVAPVISGIVETVKTSPLGDLATLDKRMKEDAFTFVLGSRE